MEPYFDPNELATWASGMTGGSQAIEVMHADEKTVALGYSRTGGGQLDVLRLTRQIEYLTRQWGKAGAPIDAVRKGNESRSLYKTPVVPTLYQLERYNGRGPAIETRYTLVMPAPGLYPLKDVHFKILRGFGFTESGTNELLQIATVELAITAVRLGEMITRHFGDKHAAHRLLKHINNRDTTHGKALALAHHFQYKPESGVDIDALVGGALKSLELRRER